MRQALKLSALTLLAALGAQTAGAQSLQLDNFTTSLSAIQNQASVTINPSTGNVVVTSSVGTLNQCTSPTVSGSVDLSGPSSSGIGTTINLSWTTQNAVGANPCTPTQGGSTSWVGQGVAGSSGTRSVVLPGAATSITFGMQCNTDAGLRSDTVTVTVTDGGGGPDCNGAPPDMMPPVNFPGLWGDVFSGLAFPNPLGNARNITIPQGFSVALRITPSATVPNGTMETAESPGNPGGPLRMSISTCPGDFRTSLNAGSKCLYPGATSAAALVFITGGAVNPSFCRLQTGTDYFVSITHKVPAFPPPPAQPVIFASDCDSGQCITLLTARSLSQAESQELGVDFVPPPDESGD